MDKTDVQNCITFYSKKGCKPCDFWYNIFEKKYKGCYNKVILRDNEEAIKTVEKFNVKTVPFLVLSNGSVLATDNMKMFIRQLG